MKLVVTGGGTGGHIFPALEVARASKEAGWDVQYYGSERGPEKSAAERAMLPFSAFPAQPLYRVYTPRGFRSALSLLKATRMAIQSIEIYRPDVVFATGGYGAAPTMQAARKLGIPYLLHEQNSVPGRANKMMSGSAHAVCTVFHAAEARFPGAKVVRTGMPIRKELRASAQGRLPLHQSLDRAAPIVLVMGGSQGSAALNDLALSCAVRMAKTEVQWLHVTGLGLYEGTMNSLSKMAIKADYSVKAYLDAEEMATALFSCSLAICRSGAGTLSELAAFRKPSILVPYPHAHGQHQLHNAREFETMRAAEVAQQGSLSPATLEARIHRWLGDDPARRAAESALADWDVPDSVPKILDLVAGAAKAGVAVA